MSSPIRSTQRAPRACTACYKAKVKCDKTIPCGRCVARGIAQDCRREVVRVQGEIHGTTRVSPNLSWDDLVHENCRLRAIITNLPAHERGGQPTAQAPLTNPFGAKGGDFETQLFQAVDHSSTPRTVASTADIILPSSESSDRILVHAVEWTFWHHCSLLVPEFKSEHDRFWDDYAQTQSLEVAHPLWLAIYFSVLASELLFMGDDDLISFDLPEMQYASLLRNWYDSALYFLDRADFVQNLDIRSTTSHEVDDAELCNVAALGGKSKLPKSKPRPVQYHIAMIKLAKICYQIKFRLRISRWQANEIAEFVFTADEQLALLISNLPSHLQFDEKQSATSIGRDRLLPWIPWQRISITKALLYYRMVIGRLLQAHWLDGSIGGTRTRAICISSAQGLINTTRGESMDPSKMRPWAVVVPIYAAVITLSLESSISDTDYDKEVQQGLDFLRLIEPHNSISTYSIQTIERLLDSSGVSFRK
ncbi:hypothetical protein QQZ08_005717 [Neonectria magnoliae]|uniref:Zn(2)-C6 fungal-type domain-containing protein n=1 Tax=Neonectria magnoliae TaxID=2732573 RepID=A0ABR1I2M5_9HYPO